MLTEQQLETYRDKRAEGYSARSALLHAKWKSGIAARHMQAAEHFAYGDRNIVVATPHRYEHEGFRLIVRVEHDDSPDLSYLGQWSDEWRPGAIDTLRGKNVHRPDSYYRYFVPTNGIEVHRGGFSENGASRHEDWVRSRACVLDDLKALASYGDKWSMVAVTVEAMRCDIVLGGDSVCGIQSDSDVHYLASTIGELEGEALDRAAKKLKQLCECR